MARVSNPKATPDDPAEKLINYLIEHKHWSPFEMVSICIDIETTRDIGRQILRHRSFHFQEFSQRYAKVVQEEPVMSSFETGIIILIFVWDQKHNSNIENLQRKSMTSATQLPPTSSVGSKVIFLDIDGPLIPGRSYLLSNQTRPVVMTFDQSAVGMLNWLARERGYRFVVHSSWLRAHGPMETVQHCISQGLLAEHFHEDPFCDEHINWRYDRVSAYLREHTDITDYVIVDDEPFQSSYSQYYYPPDMKKHLIQVDFDEGFLMRNFRQIRDGNFKYARTTH
ncbi:unnamed protein product [Sphagnum compactum]